VEFPFFGEFKIHGLKFVLPKSRLVSREGFE
jgi:hypothetical protein